MFKSPLVIEISNVFGFVTFKPTKEWDDDVQIKAYQDFS